MKIIKKILIALVAVIAILLVIAIFVDGKTYFEKSITIQASPEKVWTNTNSLKALDLWSPWNKLDPNMKKSWSGTTGAVGEKNCWEGNDKAGKGCQEIIQINPNLRKIETQIVFLTPYESESKSSVFLTPEGSNTKATWTFESETPYPFRIMNVMINLEDMIGKDFQEGLNNLKKLSEKTE